MSQLLGSAEATLNGGSAGAELPVCRKAKPRLKQTNKTSASQLLNSVTEYLSGINAECGKIEGKNMDLYSGPKKNAKRVKIKGKKMDLYLGPKKMLNVGKLKTRIWVCS